MEGRRGLSGNVADEAFCLKSAPVPRYHRGTSANITLCTGAFHQWSNCGGTRRNGVPLPFLAGQPVPLAYTTRCGWTRKTAFSRSMTTTYNTSNRKKRVLNALFKVSPIVNRGNFKSCIL